MGQDGCLGTKENRASDGAKSQEDTPEENDPRDERKHRGRLVHHGAFQDEKTYAPIGALTVNPVRLAFGEIEPTFLSIDGSPRSD
jgi:hypothetical protein